MASSHDCGHVFADVDELCSFFDREQWHLAESPEQLTATYPNINAMLVRACPAPMQMLAVDAVFYLFSTPEPAPMCTLPCWIFSVTRPRNPI